ncbi:hypothetical protein [Paenibacillus sp. J22TS3]|nr:hypothetical protein [Paenibacillus sp. J22TS3]GIP21771.1 hypothetical protein J22TS3_20460 [Paenibacillus sp. J22TS3]
MSDTVTWTGGLLPVGAVATVAPLSLLNPHPCAPAYSGEYDQISAAAATL